MHGSGRRRSSQGSVRDDAKFADLWARLDSLERAQHSTDVCKMMLEELSKSQADVATIAQQHGEDAARLRRIDETCDKLCEVGTDICVDMCVRIGTCIDMCMSMHGWNLSSRCAHVHVCVCVFVCVCV